MITNVKIKNWRSHWNSEFEFSRGTNALIGIMGSGKTSVLDAISFALFGTFPARKSKRVKLDDVIMKRPQKKQEAEVEVTFHVDGKEINVRRKIKRDIGTILSEVRENGKILNAGNMPTTRSVEKYLKVNYDLFSRAVYSEQNNLDYFLTIPKGQRMKKIDHLLKLDRFETARSNSTTLINRFKDRIETRNNLINDIEEKEDFDQIKEIEKEISHFNQEIKELKDNLEKLEKEKQKSNKKLEKMRDDIKNLEYEKDEKNKTLGIISGLKIDIEILEKKLDRKIKGRDIKLFLEKTIENRRKKEKEKEEEEEQLEKVNHLINRFQVEIENSSEHVNRLREIEGKCPLCGARLTKEHRKKIINEKEEKIISLKKQEEKKNIHKRKIEKNLERIKNEILELGERNEEIEKNYRIKKELEDKEKRLNAYQKRLNFLEKSISEKSRKINKEEVESIQENLQRLSGEIGRIKTNIENKIEFEEDKKAQLKKLKERKKIFENYKKEIEKSEKITEELKKFRLALEEVQLNLREQFIETVNLTMSDIWNDLYPYGDFIDVRLDVEGGDYILEVKNNDGEWISVEGMVSGGERSIACLALRVGFALVLASSLKWLVLDEPTHNLDSKGVENLAHVLRTKIPKFIEQIFLITHDQKLEDAVNGYLYRLKRDKEIGEATQVEKIMSPND